MMGNGIAKWLAQTRWRISPARLFIAVGVIFGIPWTLVTPPFQAPDEDLHFCRAWQLSEGHLFGREYQGVRGDSLPVSLIETITRINPGLRFHSKEQRQDPARIRFYLKQPLQSGVRAFYPFPTSVIYPPTAYLPQIIGITAARLLGLSALAAMYLGRLCNLLVWLALIYTAIRITPMGQWLFLLIAVMPMHLFLAASLSQDAAINGLFFLLLAAFLRLARQPYPLPAKKIAAVMLLTLLLSLSKPGFAIVSLLYLLLPLPPAGQRKVHYLRLVVLVAGSYALSSAWYALSQPNLDWNAPFAAYARQRSLLLSDPFYFISAFFRSLWTFKYFYIRSHIGQLGWLDTVLPLDIIGIFLLMIVAAAFLNHRGDLSPRQKALLAVVLSILFVQTFLGLWLVCSPLAGPYIHGMSGRYLIPMAPLFWLLFHNRVGRRLHLPQGSGAWLITLLIVYSLGRTTYVLLERYYF
jgi:uncharacterized membrane protein